MVYHIHLAAGVEHAVVVLQHCQLMRKSAGYYCNNISPWWSSIIRHYATWQIIMFPEEPSRPYF